ncbi:isopentenyl pyrophosphate:dimethylallyl pyrophosphate isomerase [Aspergillus oryzae 100-8]|uniref:Isopentenyl pyrophosphate,dimethylallyl pyrophosphate isomerase n=1 Tax=Aspergillus oryzae (strain 3.042) TaxID=1160506 RepID=I7ZT97_ASPO3|nr:isopentenyl pyrophosphate,dimethylallyl pyrophosphate isomerase [Aspergillus oryzae 3.042]KDE81282.1 isopentenyl pyrophosphate:dimethylallyl pyrophosphate isomerase [Aspergillus oryzae 100-8]|eukprot:EIT75157.1 isopentenyl pyrophosphate,dimethylallyl pyrophosphate isomerase [Aspergillus oryzae 3.042]
MGHTEANSSAITAENVHELFPEVEALSAVSPVTCGVSAAESGDFEGYDEEQVWLMDEDCIVLDVDDEPIGRASKRVCHPMTDIDKGLLHRAFSSFKVTFPMMWTNTCCSHPLDIPARRATRRKLEQELGIKPEQVPLEDFHFSTRVHYKAPSDWKRGEHEISPEDLKNMFATPGLQYTAWFKLICESLLLKWWADLGTPEFQRNTNETIIRRM